MIFKPGLVHVTWDDRMLYCDVYILHVAFLKHFCYIILIANQRFIQGYLVEVGKMLCAEPHTPREVWGMLP